jgi:hypothetical protein
MQDILLGAVDLYDWHHVKNWVRSAKASGFTGRIVLLCYRVADELIEQCTKEGVELYSVTSDRYNQPLQHGLNGHASDVHQLRFFHFWQFLSGVADARYCITTDVRDVIFQTNPSEWLESNLQDRKFTIPSENIKFQHESWNQANVLNSLGPNVYSLLSESLVANVGTIGGDAKYLANLFLTLHTMTIGLSLPSDQSCFNLLCNGLLKEQGLQAGDKEGWCAQLGVTDAVSKPDSERNLVEPKPVYRDGFVYNSENKLYSLVHQYDRIQELNNLINNRYN